MKRSPPQWNAYVLSGKNSQERLSRLSEVPKDWRAGVKSHVETVYKIRAAQKKR